MLSVYAEILVHIAQRPWKLVELKPEEKLGHLIPGFKIIDLAIL